jgi:hypothetical protein
VVAGGEALDVAAKGPALVVLDLRDTEAVKGKPRVRRWSRENVCVLPEVAVGPGYRWRRTDADCGGGLEGTLEMAQQP